MQHKRTIDRLQADYVIVGGGSAGLVLANRLSEGDATVLLIEAGGEAHGLLAQLPAGFGKLVGDPDRDWRYGQEPDPTINDRQLMWSAGRMLGGGSAINGQVYIRGTRGDFARWAESGAPGWTYDDVEPFYRRAERWEGEPDQMHGESGPLSVSPMRDVHPYAGTFLDACAQVGLRSPVRCNDGTMDGAFLTLASQRDGWRCSTEKAYLRPARRRKNLRVMVRTEVARIRLDGAHAIGVTARRQGERIEIDARRDVILSAGALGSPAVLMRSGIGPAGNLRAVGIEIVHDLPGVGQNLQEHASVRLTKCVDGPTLNADVGSPRMLAHLLRYAWDRRGILSAPIVQSMALARTREDLPEPDIQLLFIPLAVERDPETLKPVKERAITISACLSRPRARGRVDLAADGTPRVSHRLLGDERDLDTLINGARLVQRIFEASSFARIVTGNYRPDAIPTTRDGWVEFIRKQAGTAFHPVGTCRMGSDSMAVVDDRLRVRGIAGLRVIDASVMPYLTSVNTNATTIMLAEKAADLIRSEHR